MSDLSLNDIMSSILPGPSVTPLLQAALWQETEARWAWERWVRQTGSLTAFLRHDQTGLKRLLPLLEHNLRQQQIPVDREAGPILRAAAIREEVRFRSFAAHGRAALEGLAAAGIEPIVLKGAAAAALYYPTPGLRHCHDLDLLVPPKVMPTIAQGLARAGFSTAEPVAGTHSVRFIHRSGLPIECHLSPLRGSVYLIERSALMARTRSAIVIGSTCRVLQGGDMLAHICGHAPQNPRRRSMTWLVDAYLLIGREQALWPSFLEATMAMRVEVPALAALNYLRDRLHAPVPDAVLTELRRQTRSISSRGRRAAMRISLDARRLSVAGLWRSLCWRSRLAIRGRFTSIVQR